MSHRIDELEEALWCIAQWSDAYPLDVVPEPDLEKARQLLAAGGITLDAVSASRARHVVKVLARSRRTLLVHRGIGRRNDDTGATLNGDERPRPAARAPAARRSASASIAGFALNPHSPDGSAILSAFEAVVV